LWGERLGQELADFKLQVLALLRGARPLRIGADALARGLGDGGEAPVL
jgi:hypothetical protein